MCRPIERVARTIAAAVTLGTVLAGCSDLYYDRRDTIALSSGDAVAANEIAQTIDPWPPQSGNTHIATNGQRMQSAIERYRTNKVTPPVNPTTLDIMNPQQATQAAQTTSQPAAAPPTTTTSTQISSQ
jgi:hypothetical protein